MNKSIIKDKIAYLENEIKLKGEQLDLNLREQERITSDIYELQQTLNEKRDLLNRIKMAQQGE